MDIIINEENLKNEEIHDFNLKARAILIDESNRILIANYAKVILLPGGSIEKDETIYDGIKRELKEELGIVYEDEELQPIITLYYYQRNYPKRDGTLKNRLVQTHYFLADYKDIADKTQELTESESKGNFKLELVSLQDLEEIIIENKNDNPRNIYFQKELLKVIDIYKNINSEMNIKRLKLNKKY